MHYSRGKLLFSFLLLLFASHVYGQPFDPFQSGVLSGPPYPKVELFRFYSWEVKDPQHRYGLAMREKKKYFDRMQDQFGSTCSWRWKNHFLEWLDSEGHGDEIPKVIYLDETERADYSVEFRGNSISSKKLTQYFSSLKPEGTSILMYVMDEKGTFYVGPKIVGQNGSHSFHHSSFFAGGPVSSAGMIAVKNDTHELIMVSNCSGHYRLGSEGVALALIELQRQKVDLRQIEVLNVDSLGELKLDEPKMAQEWLEGYVKKNGR